MTETLDELLAELLQSGTPPPSPPRASVHERIVQSALEVFAAQSYEGATTKAIAAHAGVTERTLFKHFPSKEGLFARTVFPALVQMMAPFTMEPVARLLDAHAGDFAATIRALVVERVAFATRHPAIITMAVREGLLRPAFRRAVVTIYNRRMRPHLEMAVAQAQRSGQIRDLPADVVVRAVVGQIATYVAARVLLAPDAPWDDTVEVERIVTLVMHGIAGPSAEAGSTPDSSDRP